MCIEPPRPSADAVDAAEQLRHHAVRGSCRARARGRASGRSRSGSRRRACARAAPTIVASSPIARCRKPPILAFAYISPARSSKRRMSIIVAQPLARDVGLGEGAVGHQMQDVSAGSLRVRCGSTAAYAGDEGCATGSAAPAIDAIADHWARRRAPTWRARPARPSRRPVRRPRAAAGARARRGSRGLLAEVEAVRVDDQLDGAVAQPEVEQADARDELVSVSGWNVVIVADRHSASPRRRSITQAIWSRPLPA